MNIGNIRELADILAAYGLSALEVTEGETKIRMEKSLSAVQTTTQTVASTVPPVIETNEDDKSVNFNRLTEVTSPLVGVFYSAPSPDADTFVSIGGTVKKGDTLCIIEAMKMMNEITAERDGEIVDICVKNDDIVEFGQVLFKIF